MELFLNLVWLSVSLLLVITWIRSERRGRKKFEWSTVIALLLLLVLLFPVISMTDDLIAINVASEVEHTMRRYEAPPSQTASVALLDAIALMYCWTLLDVEQPTFAGSRSLLAPDRTRGWVPAPTSFQLRVLGAYSRHILKGMKRISVETGDPDLLATAFAGGNDETLIVINRSATARRLAVQGAAHPWAEIERTGLEEENAASPFRTDNVIQPGEIVVFSTIKVE